MRKPRLVITLALATAILALIYGSEAHADPVNHQVHTFWNPIKFAKLLAACGLSIVKGGEKMDPSPECCEVLKEFDLTLLCLFMPPIVRKVIDVEKLIYTAMKCDQPVDPGTNCGGYIVPPPSESPEPPPESLEPPGSSEPPSPPPESREPPAIEAQGDLNCR